MSPMLNVRSTESTAMLSEAETLNERPPVMVWLSTLGVTLFGVVSVSRGAMLSRETPPVLAAVSQPPSTIAPKATAAYRRTFRPASIRTPASVPGAGSRQVVDDVGRDQDQQIAPFLLLIREPEQLAQNGQVHKERDSRLAYRDVGHRQAANYGRFAVVDENLIVRLLGLNRVADVDRGGLHARIFRMDFHEDLPVRRHVRRHLQVD